MIAMPTPPIAMRPGVSFRFGFSAGASICGLVHRAEDKAYDRRAMAASHSRRSPLAELIEPLRVAPGKKVVLGRDFDPRYDGGLDKATGRGSAGGGRSSCSPSTRSGSPPRTRTACSSSCRRSTPPARTARSGT